MSIPNSISYRNVKPLGIPSRIRKVKFIPNNVYGDIKPNDIVRFHIKAPTFWDPYNCYVRLKVDFSDAHPDCVQQIDSSAQSFISELVVSAGSTEIERIQEYDVLASMLLDNTYNIEERKSKLNEGLNGENFPSLAFTQNNRDIVHVKELKSLEKPTEVFHGWVPQGYKPTLIQPNKGAFYHVDKTLDYEVEPAQNDHRVFNRGDVTNPINVLNQYDSTKIYPLLNMLDRADINFLNQRKRGHPGVMQKIYKYPFFKDDVLALQHYGNINGDDEPVVGTPNMFSAEYSSGCFEDCYSSKATEWILHNGKSAEPKKVTRTQGEYIFPLMSGVLGILMPKDNYKLFPAFAVDNLTLEFRINPYAVFTSGYESPILPGTEEAYSYIGATNKTGVPRTSTIYTEPQKTQFKRTFKITTFELMVDLIQFDDSVTDLMKSQLQGEGIVLATHSFALGPLFNKPDTRACVGTYQLNMGFESLKTIYLTFLSNDYLQYSFCRKNFRLSSNLTSLQAKIGLEYFPEKALEGHGGNSYTTNPYEESNWIYVYELIRQFGHLNEPLSHTIINKHNFAINERAYDVTNTGPYVTSLTSQLENNNDTAVGYPLIHENRMVGKAIYVLNLAYNADSNMFNGLNTIQNRPFDIILKTDGNTVSNKDRPRTVMFFIHYDMIVQISLGSVRVLGRA